jgi:hypothetical protein
MAIDITWVLINITKAIDMEFQWLHLDSTMLFFVLTILFLFPSLSQVRPETYVWLVVIVFGATFADYKLGWKSFWSRFDVSEKAM